jgi:Ca2+-dependent lipid-binding protein
VQDCSLYENSGGGTTIGENAVDVKSCERVLITGNEMYGFRSNTTSPMNSRWGDAVVMHCDADHVIVEKNKIHDCGRAASVGGTGIAAGTRGVGKVIVRSIKSMT